MFRKHYILSFRCSDTFSLKVKKLEETLINFVMFDQLKKAKMKTEEMISVDGINDVESYQLVGIKDILLIFGITNTFVQNDIS